MLLNLASARAVELNLQVGFSYQHAAPGERILHVLIVSVIPAYQGVTLCTGQYQAPARPPALLLPERRVFHASLSSENLCPRAPSTGPLPGSKTPHSLAFRLADFAIPGPPAALPEGKIMRSSVLSMIWALDRAVSVTASLP